LPSSHIEMLLIISVAITTEISITT
jgi:hypothetical protein